MDPCRLVLSELTENQPMSPSPASPKDLFKAPRTQRLTPCLRFRPSRPLFDLSSCPSSCFHRPFIAGMASEMRSETIHVSAKGHLACLKSTERDIFKTFIDEDSASPSFACDFSLNDRHLALGGEDGHIQIIDMQSTNEEQDVRVVWDGHGNAIFDLKFTKKANHLVSAGGDQRAKLWDVSEGKCVAIFGSHTGSVKTVDTHPQNPAIFATGARDGNILLWDTRCVCFPNEEGSIYKPVAMVNKAHVGASTPAPTKKRARLSNSGKTFDGLTTVLFVPTQEHSLISAGSTDGKIKLWDLRVCRSTNPLRQTVPVSTSKHMSYWKRPHGFSSLTIHQNGSTIYASCTDSHIYEFSTVNIYQPIKSYTSKLFDNSSFYTKIDLSPCGRFLASGSCNQMLYIWETKDKGKKNIQTRPMVYEGHSKEVSSVRWSRSGQQIMTCSDDYTARLWWFGDRKQEEMDTEQPLSLFHSKCFMEPSCEDNERFNTLQQHTNTMKNRSSGNRTLFDFFKRD